MYLVNGVWLGSIRTIKRVKLKNTQDLGEITQNEIKYTNEQN
jgi:hypothetical protein